MRRCLMILLCLIFSGLNVFPAVAQDQPLTLTEQIAAREDLTIFRRLLALGDPAIRAWLDNPANRFTVFAPTDAAWQQYFDFFGDSFEALTRRPNQVNNLLRYHIVPVIVAPQDIPSVYCSDLGTMLPDSRLIIGQGQDTLTVNYDSALAFPIAAANGVLYEVDHVLIRLTLMPTSGDHTPDDVIKPTVIPDPPLSPIGVGVDAQTVLEQEGQFTTLLSLLAAFPPYQDLAHSDGLYILLAPTDAAFERYFRENDLTLETFQADYGAAFTAYSLWPGYFFPATFQSYSMLSPTFCGLDLMGAAQIEEAGDSAWTVDQIPYTRAVFFARNAVIYVVDGIRLPQPRFMG